MPGWLLLFGARLLGLGARLLCFRVGRLLSRGIVEAWSWGAVEPWSCIAVELWTWGCEA